MAAHLVRAPPRAAVWRRIGSRGTALLVLVALAVYGVQSIALPVVPGRDFGTYLRFYVQMFEWDSVLPMSMLYRTPLAPLVVGGSLDLAGGYAAQALMAVLYATSIVCWTRTALAFGRRAALVTAGALLLYPGYGILFHMLSSDSICAFVFAVWALALTRAFLEPTAGRFALLGLATAAAALTRPGYQVLAVFALLPLVLGIPWRGRLVASAAFLGVVALIARRVDREQRRAVRRLRARARWRRILSLLPRVRHRSDRLAGERRGVARARRRGRTELLRRGAVPLVRDHARAVFRGRRLARVRGRRRDHGSRLGVETDYAQMRKRGHRGGQGASVAVRAGRRRHGPRRALEPAARRLPRADSGASASRWSRVGSIARSTGFRRPSEGEQIPSARQGFFSTTPDGSITEVWTSPTDHRLVFSTPEAQRRFDGARSRERPLERARTAVSGERLVDAPVQPLVEALSTSASVARRRDRGVALAAAGAWFARGRSGRRRPPRLSFQALAVYSIIEFAVPVAPALVVFGAAGLVGQRRASAV